MIYIFIYYARVISAASRSLTYPSLRVVANSLIQRISNYTTFRYCSKYLKSKCNIRFYLSISVASQSLALPTFTCCSKCSNSKNYNYIL